MPEDKTHNLYIACQHVLRLEVTAKECITPEGDLVCLDCLKHLSDSGDISHLTTICKECKDRLLMGLPAILNG